MNDLRTGDCEGLSSMRDFEIFVSFLVTLLEKATLPTTKWVRLKESTRGEQSYNLQRGSILISSIGNACICALGISLCRTSCWAGRGRGEGGHVRHILCISVLLYRKPRLCALHQMLLHYLREDWPS